MRNLVKNTNGQGGGYSPFADLSNSDLTLTQDLSLVVKGLRFTVVSGETTSRMNYSGGPIWLYDENGKQVTSGPNFNLFNSKLFSEIGSSVKIYGVKIGGILDLGLTITRTGINSFELIKSASINEFTLEFSGAGASNEHSQPNAFTRVEYDSSEQLLKFYST